MKKIFVFGNEDLEQDNLPLRILPELQKQFPDIEFIVKDPNEEWEIEGEKEIIVLDTALGIEEVTVFESLENFAKAPRVGVHDFDALTNLKFLQKLGKIKKIKIIAVPQDLNESEAVEKIVNKLSDRTKS